MAILTHPSALDASVEQLAEVGPKTARLLEKLGIRTVRDLLVTLPFGWESFVESPISELVPGAQASVVGTILSIKPLHYRDPSRVAFILGTNAARQQRGMNLPLADAMDLGRQMQSFERVAAYQ